MTDRHCLACTHSDGRSGLWPWVLYCDAPRIADGRASALWARGTPPEARGCGPDATLFEERKP